MRMQKLVLALVALALPIAAQNAAPAATNTPAATKKAPEVSPAPADPAERQKLHDSAMKFLESADVRQRLQDTIGKLLDDGKRSMMTKNPGLDPAFGDEWLKRMRERVSLDQIVEATAEVYEKYFTSDELDQLTQRQLALKQGRLYSVTSKLADKLKADSTFIQRDINASTSIVGGRLGAEVGKEIERDHPEWIHPLTDNAPAPKKS